MPPSAPRTARGGAGVFTEGKREEGRDARGRDRVHFLGVRGKGEGRRGRSQTEGWRSEEKKGE